MTSTADQAKPFYSHAEVHHTSSLLSLPQVLDKYYPPDYYLPESYTCFFLLKIPRYSCKPVLEEKLRYAINFCKSIDTDDYARVNLQVQSLSQGHRTDV